MFMLLSEVMTNFPFSWLLSTVLFRKVCLCCYDAVRPYVFTCGLKCAVFSSGLCSRWGMFNRSTSLMKTQIERFLYPLFFVSDLFNKNGVLLYLQA